MLPETYVTLNQLNKYAVPERICRKRMADSRGVKGKQVKGLCELVTVNTENSCVWKRVTGKTREGRQLLDEV